MSPESSPGGAAGSRVLLVHGIWNARHWLAPFGMRLRREGLSPELFGYASVLGGAEIAAGQLVERLRRSPVDLLVGHSLGGLVILEALRSAPDLPVKRVVCLGSPLRGSGVAAAIGDRKPLSLLLGRSRGLLESGCPPWQGAAEVGMVAGVRARGVGGWFVEGGVHIDGESDGTVTVAETRLPGLTGHCIVPASHTGLVMSAQAAVQTAHFLRHGCFV